MKFEWNWNEIGMKFVFYMKIEIKSREKIDTFRWKMSF
jgi:hypothetical protein